MSVLKCEDCGCIIGKYRDDIDISICPNCKSTNLIRSITFDEKIDFPETIRGKSNKMPGKKKRFSEFQAGEEYSVDKHKFVDKVRQIDRENNNYFEKVSDHQTGKVIHECSEPLSEHSGHGTAKLMEKEPNEIDSLEENLNEIADTRNQKNILVLFIILMIVAFVAIGLCMILDVL